MSKNVQPAAYDVEADRRLDAEMQKYAGKWVAVVKHRIVAVGENLGTVLEQAKAQGYAEPLVMRAPAPSSWILMPCAVLPSCVGRGTSARTMKVNDILLSHQGVSGDTRE